MVFVTVAGCCRPVTVGKVVSKDYHPAWVQFTLINKVMVPIHHPAYWSVTLSDGPDESTCRVPEQVFDSLAVGNHYACESR